MTPKRGFYLYLKREDKWQWEGVHHETLQESTAFAEKLVRDGADEVQVFLFMGAAEKKVIYEDAQEEGKKS